MLSRKCRVCNGKGSLWGTPPLIENGGLLNSNTSKGPLSDSEVKSYGLSVTCWRCNGHGMVHDRQDGGASNG